MLLWAAFRVVPHAEPERLRATARESLAFRKRTQPLESPSAGCIFMNPDAIRDRVPPGLPPSAGALVHRAGLKGAAVGGAQVSTTHANFIINTGTASAADIVGWFKINQSNTVCDYSTTASLADQAATSAGVTLSQYTRKVYAFPKNSCTWWGLGSVGGNPSRSWITGSLQLRVVAHEMGHNLGLYHSGKLGSGAFHAFWWKR